jgi:hypothetical protein
LGRGTPAATLLKRKLIRPDQEYKGHLHDAIELSLINLQGLPRVKPGENYEKADAFDMGPMKIEQKAE